MFKSEILAAASTIPQIDANMADPIIYASPLSENERVQQEMDTERQFKAAFFIIWEKLQWMIKTAFFLLCPILSPIFYNAYSSTFKLKGFNKSLKPLHISIPAWAIASLVMLSTVVFYFYTTQPYMKGYKNTPTKSLREQWNEYLKNKKQGKLRTIAYLLILINLAFFIWTTGANAYEIFNPGSPQSIALCIAALCALGALTSTVTYVWKKAPSAFPHLLNIKKLYKNEKYGTKRFKGCLLVVLALVQIPLFMTLSLGKMPWWLALISSTLTALITYTMSVSTLCRKEIKDLNANGSESKELNTDDAAIDNEFSKKGTRFFIAATLFYINCLITAVGTGFGVEFVLSDQSELKNHFRFKLDWRIVLTLAFFSGALALFGRCYFSGYKKTIVAMMRKMTDISNNIKQLSTSNRVKVVLFIAVSTMLGGIVGYMMHGNTLEGALLSAFTTIAIVLLSLCKETNIQTQTIESTTQATTQNNVQTLT